jgi:hypothetical protein
MIKFVYGTDFVWLILSVNSGDILSLNSSEMLQPHNSFSVEIPCP